MKKVMSRGKPEGKVPSRKKHERKKEEFQGSSK
jgi:hypothetical protein